MAAGVDDLLDTLLGKEELVDLPAQGDVFPGDDLLCDQLEDERSITDPSEEVIWVVGARAGNHNSGLASGKFESEGRVKG